MHEIQYMEQKVFEKSKFKQDLSSMGLSDLIPLSKSGNEKTIGAGKSAVNLYYLQTTGQYDSIEKIKGFLEAYFSNITSINYSKGLYSKSADISNITLVITEPTSGGGVDFYNPFELNNIKNSRTSDLYRSIAVYANVNGREENSLIFSFIILEIGSKSNSYGADRVLREALVAMYLNSLIRDDESDFYTLSVLSQFDLSTEEIVKDYLIQNGMVSSYENSEDFQLTLFDEIDDTVSDTQYIRQAQALYNDLNSRYVDLTDYYKGLVPV